jgi:hypothetical protein
MWYLTIADEKSYRRTFPLDSSIDLTGLLSLKVFNIELLAKFGYERGISVLR